MLGEYTPLDLSIRDTMEQAPSKHADYVVLLKTLLRSSGVKVKEQNFQELLQAIHKHGHWLDPEKGTLRLNEWKEVMRGLRQAYQSGDPIPVSVCSLFNLIFITLAPLPSERSDSSDSDSDTLGLPASQESPVRPPHIYENLDKGKYNPLEGEREAQFLSSKSRVNYGTEQHPKAFPSSPVSQPSAPWQEPPVVQDPPSTRSRYTMG